MSHIPEHEILYSLFQRRLGDHQLQPCRLPDITLEVIIKHNLEASRMGGTIKVDT